MKMSSGIATAICLAFVATVLAAQYREDAVIPEEELLEQLLGAEAGNTVLKTMDTPNTGKYAKQVALTGLKEPFAIEVEVEAKNDAHLFLLEKGKETPCGGDNANGYEVVLGGWGNSLSVIRTGCQKPNKGVVKHAGAVVGTNKFHRFLVEKSAEVLNIKDDSGKILMAYTKAHRVIDKLYLMSGWGATAKWRFAMHKGKSDQDGAIGDCKACHAKCDGIDVEADADACESACEKGPCVNEVDEVVKPLDTKDVVKDLEHPHADNKVDKTVEEAKKLSKDCEDADNKFPKENSPFVATDAAINPATKVYELGCGRRRVGAGYAKYHKPKVVKKVVHHNTTVTKTKTNATALSKLKPLPDTKGPAPAPAPALQCQVATAKSSKAGVVKPSAIAGATVTGGGINNHYRSWDAKAGFEESYPDGNQYRCDMGFGPGKVTCYGIYCSVSNTKTPLDCTTKSTSFDGSGLRVAKLPAGYTMTGGGLKNTYRSFNKKAGFEDSRPSGNDGWAGDMGFGPGKYTAYVRGCKDLTCKTITGKRGNTGTATCPSGYQVTGCGIKNYARKWNKKSGFEQTNPKGNGCFCDGGFGTGDVVCYARCCKLDLNALAPMETVAHPAPVHVVPAGTMHELKRRL